MRVITMIKLIKSFAIKWKTDPVYWEFSSIFLLQVAKFQRKDFKVFSEQISLCIIIWGEDMIWPNLEAK